MLQNEKKEHKMPKLMGDCEGGSKKQVHKEGRDHTFITQQHTRNFQNKKKK